MDICNDTECENVLPAPKVGIFGRGRALKIIVNGELVFICLFYFN